MQSKLVGLMAGIGLGTCLMYLLDPDRGKQRRAQVRDRAKRTSRQLGRVAKSVDRTAHDIARGTEAITKRAFSLKRKALRLVA
jgi:gas vesicle protein